MSKQFFQLFGDEDNRELELRVRRDERTSTKFCLRDGEETIETAHNLPTAYVEAYNNDMGDVVPESYEEAKDQYEDLIDRLINEGELENKTTLVKLADKNGKEIKDDPTFRLALARPVQDEYFSLQDGSKPAQFLEDLHNNPTDYDFDSDDASDIRSLIEDGIDKHYSMMLNSMASEYKESVALNVDWHLNELNETVTTHRFEDAENYFEKTKQLFLNALKKRIKDETSVPKPQRTWRS